MVHSITCMSWDPTLTSSGAELGVVKEAQTVEVAEIMEL